VCSSDLESFERADKILNTYNFFHKLEEDNDNQVDGAEYLKARLLDLFLGDWDRHTDQWRWAGYKQGKVTMWKPIPRDRDHAFSRQEGLVPWGETQILPQMNNFNEDYPRIWFLTWSGRVLDRKLLTGVSKAKWDSVTTFVQRKLTDSLISAAVRRMPDEMYAKEGPWLESVLKSRRDQLHEASEKLYSIYADFVDIEGSDKRDYAEITRLPEGKLDVSLFKRDKDTGEQKGSPFYHRIFSPSETQEIRVYLLGGDDMSMVKGDVDKSMIVRVIGGEGSDEFVDSSRVAHPGLFRSRLTYFYDSGEKTVFKTGPNTGFDREKVAVPKDDVEKYEHRLRDYGQEWWYSIDNLQFNYTPDFGLFLGWGVRLEDYAFRTAPYSYRMGLQGGYAFGEGKTEFEYEADIRSVVQGGRFLINAKSTGLDLIKFYGFGNESKLVPNVDKDDFYESEQPRYQLETKLEYPVEGTFKFNVGSAIKYINIDLEPNTFLNERKPYGISNKFLGSLSAGFEIDTRQGGTTSLEGFYLQAQGTYYPKIFQNDFNFARLKAEARLYLPLPLKLSRIVLRASGEKIWGTYPFFEAAYLGGVKSIRGYDQQRFAGDASLFGGAELRLYLTKVNLLVPIYFGP
ncbi:MAG: BamA/TamA family outer membrane protein, partial [Chlorobiales bacterium]|nr:BamA/TamA family outer membrane protein [Chlorobiales bacterium]